MNLEAQLHQYFGFRSFRPGQKEAITSVLSGTNTSAMLPTGTGKSLCYQLAGYLIEGQVIIVSPLLSLMQDQVEQMIQSGEKRVVALNSFLSFHERMSVLNRLDDYKFIFISPEMLSIPSIGDRIKKLKIALFVVDEAHCISQWGYDFRPEYARLGEFRKKVGSPLTLALTATATPEVRKDILHSLNLKEAAEIVFTVDRPNIALHIEKIQNHNEKPAFLLNLVEELGKPGIVYFSSKMAAEQMAQFLTTKGTQRVSAYHGGMETEQRILVQQQFLNSQLDVICATSAFGMGINKENIRFIIHYHMPLQLESYLQEIGRAGRDGRPSIAILLHSPGDIQLPIGLIERELPSRLQIDMLSRWLNDGNHKSLFDLDQQKQAEIRNLCSLSDVQWRFILEFLKDRSLSTKTLAENLFHLTYLVEDRVKIKRDNIDYVKNWIDSKECRRKSILQFFSEELNDKPLNCCDICGISLNDFKQLEADMNKDQYIYRGWMKHLEKLFGKKE